MAGRGRQAVVPAWLQSGHTPAAPGAPPSQPPQTTTAATPWTEHIAPDGRTYYYNSVTKVSSWTKPEALEQQHPEGQASDWKEFRAPDGRPYWYNKITKVSRWTVPPILIGSSGEPQHTMDQSTTKKGAHHQATAQLSSGIQQHAVSGREAFLQLLQDVQVQSHWSWDFTHQIIRGDRRYDLVPTVGEKKAVFQEYVSGLQTAEAEESKKRCSQYKEPFFAMIDECGFDLDQKPLLTKVELLCGHDPRWRAVHKATEREQLFEEWLKARQKAAKEMHSEELKKKKEAFRELLEAAGFLNSFVTWRQVKDRLADEQEFLALKPQDRFYVFEEFMKELEEKENDQKSKEQREKVRAERISRDRFLQRVVQHTRDGTIQVYTRWHEYLPLIQETQEYKDIIKNTTGSRPKELFMDVIEDLEGQWIPLKAALTSFFEHAGRLSFMRTPPGGGADTKNDTKNTEPVFKNYEEFRQHLGEKIGWDRIRAEDLPLTDSFPLEKALEMYFEMRQWEVTAPKIRAEKEHAKLVQSAEEAFLKLLKKKRKKLNRDSSWDVVESVCCGHEAWQSELLDDESKRRLFASFFDSLTKDAQEKKSLKRKLESISSESEEEEGELA